MTPQRTSRPARSEPPPLSEPELHFCAICQVSIAAAEIDRGTALRTPRGRAFCGVCAVATPEERARRRTALEQEFADDAPVPVPVARARRPATPAPLPVAVEPAPEPTEPLELVGPDGDEGDANQDSPSEAGIVVVLGDFPA